MVRVVMKAAVEETEAPLSSKEPASGNAISDGMCNSAPSPAIVKIPAKPIAGQRMSQSSQEAQNPLTDLPR